MRAHEEPRERERAEAIVVGVRIEDAAMAAGLVALRDDRVDARRRERARLGDARRRAEEDDARARRSACTRSRRRNAEVEAHDLRPLGDEHGEHLVVLDEAR